MGAQHGRAEVCVGYAGTIKIDVELFQQLIDDLGP